MNGKVLLYRPILLPLLLLYSSTWGPLYHILGRTTVCWRSKRDLEMSSERRKASWFYFMVHLASWCRFHPWGTSTIPKFANNSSLWSSRDLRYWFRELLIYTEHSTADYICYFHNTTGSLARGGQPYHQTWQWDADCHQHADSVDQRRWWRCGVQMHRRQRYTGSIWGKAIGSTATDGTV